MIGNLMNLGDSQPLISNNICALLGNFFKK